MKRSRTWVFILAVPLVLVLLVVVYGFARLALSETRSRPGRLWTYEPEFYSEKRDAPVLGVSAGADFVLAANRHSGDSLYPALLDREGNVRWVLRVRGGATGYAFSHDDRRVALLMTSATNRDERGVLVAGTDFGPKEVRWLDLGSLSGELWAPSHRVQTFWRYSNCIMRTQVRSAAIGPGRLTRARAAWSRSIPRVSVTSLRSFPADG